MVAGKAVEAGRTQELRIIIVDGLLTFRLLGDKGHFFRRFRVARGTGVGLINLYSYCTRSGHLELLLCASAGFIFSIGSFWSHATLQFM